MLVRSDGFVRSKKPHRKAPAPIVKKHLLYEIEKVVNARDGKYGREYFVKWRGYKSIENTWIGDLPPFFKKTSRFYIGAKSKHDASVESESESGSDTDSDEDDSVDSDEEDDAIDSDIDEANDSDIDDDDDDDESDDEYTTPEPTLRKRKRVGRNVNSTKTDQEGDVHTSKKCKCSYHNARKFILEEDDDDDEDDNMAGPSKVVVTESVVEPKVVIQIKAASHDKTKSTKKEQLAMRALLALANYVNDTESDSE